MFNRSPAQCLAALLATAAAGASLPQVATATEQAALVHPKEIVLSTLARAEDDAKGELPRAMAVSVLVAMDDGTLVPRPVDGLFRTGEMFRLRVLPTVSGTAVVKTTDPAGHTSELLRVPVSAGLETLIPADPDRLFKFVGATGEERVDVEVFPGGHEAQAAAAPQRTAKHVLLVTETTGGQTYAALTGGAPLPAPAEGLPEAALEAHLVLHHNANIPKMGPVLLAVVAGAAKEVFTMFVHWLTGRPSTSPTAAGGKSDGQDGTGSAPQLTTLPSPRVGVDDAAAGAAAAADGAEPGSRSAAASAAIVPAASAFTAPLASPVILGAPDIPFRRRESGEANYQGVHVSVVGVDATSGAAGFHSLAEGFTGGERFKLRIVATFDSQLVVDAVNAAGERRRLYPAPFPESETPRVLSLRGGRPAIIPADPQQFFQFVDEGGPEKLEITVRDVQAGDARLSDQPVYRQDEAWGSNFLQVTPPGAYAGFTGSLALMHVAAKNGPTHESPRDSR